VTNEELRSTSYAIRWIEDEFGVDPNDDNVDVFVNFTNGVRYVATFFALANLRTLLEKYRQTGECAGGTFVWSTYMIVVEHLTREAVEKTVADLIATGEFGRAFEGPYTDTNEPTE
jgi:hypothetical protein